MAGKASRDKGRWGERRAKRLLTSRDWVVDDLAGGLASADLVATDTNGRTWLVEVKNTDNILVEHRNQARRQARERKLPWLLMSHISGTRSWLVQRQGQRPVLWHEPADECTTDPAHEFETAKRLDLDFNTPTRRPALTVVKAMALDYGTAGEVK